MSDYIFKLPDVGEGIVEVEVLEWMVSIGDVIEADQALADVMTDKANVEISTPIGGKVLKLICNAGEMAPVGCDFVVLEIIGDIEPTKAPTTSDKTAYAQAITATKALEESVGAVNTPPIISPPASYRDIPNKAFNKALASPAIRRRARQTNVDLSQVVASDSYGRISHADLNAFISASSNLAIGSNKTARTSVKKVKQQGLRRIIGEKMLLSKQSAPHYSYVEEIDITELQKLRKHLNENRSKSQSKLSLLPFIMLATVRALNKFPQCNAHYETSERCLLQYDGVHIGMATTTEAGLKVPVIRHVEAMNIWQCAEEVQRLSEAARGNTAARAELSGSTITISSLGALGGIASTPILNHPEVSIIGINKAVHRVVVENGQMVIRTMMNISASFDHRAIDGYEGASFIQCIKSLLEYPATVFM